MDAGLLIHRQVFLPHSNGVCPVLYSFHSSCKLAPLMGMDVKFMVLSTVFCKQHC